MPIKLRTISHHSNGLSYIFSPSVVGSSTIQSPHLSAKIQCSGGVIPKTGNGISIREMLSTDFLTLQQN